MEYCIAGSDGVLHSREWWSTAQQGVMEYCTAGSDGVLHSREWWSTA
jgi:hypothetical protein